MIVRNLIIFLVLLLTLSFFVNGEMQSLGTFGQNDCVDLIQICSNCTYNNISSVLYPDSTLALSQSAMTKVDTVYNKTFCSTTQLGTYIVNGYGDLNGVKTIWNYDFKITVDGITQNDSGKIEISFMIILGVAMIFLFGLGYIFFKENNMIFFLSFLCWYIALVLPLFGLRILSESNSITTDMVNILDTAFIVYLIFYMVMILMLVVYFIILALTWLDWSKKQTNWMKKASL